MSQVATSGEGRTVARPGDGWHPPLSLRDLARTSTGLNGDHPGRSGHVCPGTGRMSMSDSGTGCPWCGGAGGVPSGAFHAAAIVGVFFRRLCTTSSNPSRPTFVDEYFPPTDAKNPILPRPTAGRITAPPITGTASLRRCHGHAGGVHNQLFIVSETYQAFSSIGGGTARSALFGSDGLDEGPLPRFQSSAEFVETGCIYQRRQAETPAFTR